MIRERRSIRRVVLAGGLAAVLGAVLVLAVTGTRESASALKLLSGDVWLGNATGTVSHVDGYSGKVDGQAAVTGPHDPFTVIQRPDGAYILDLKTGRLSRVGSAGLDVTGSRRVPGDLSALQVLTSGSTSWVLDHSSGVLQQVDATTLAPDGPQVALGAPTGMATVDGDGNLWVPIPSRAVVVDVAASDHSLSSHPLGQPGDAVVVAATSGGVWGIDVQAGQARSLSDPAIAALPLAQAAAGVVPLVGFSPASDHIAVVANATLVDINTAHPSVSSTTSPDLNGAVSVVVNGDTAFVLNAAAHQLDSINLNPLRQGPSANVPAGSSQLVSKDNLVFVNNPASPQAVVVNANGEVTPITKYLPGNVSPSSASPLGSTAAAANQPTPGLSGLPGPSGLSGLPGPLTPTGVIQPTPTPTPSVPNSAPAIAPTPANPQAPGAPTVTAVSATAGALAVTWSPPASTGSSPITSYKVSALPQGSGSAGATTAGGATTNATVGSLSGGVAYCAQVQAVNATGAGPLSVNNGSPTVCAKTTADSPGQVATPAATGGAGRITVAWTQPGLGPYNTPIASYTVTATPQSGGAAVTKTATAGPLAVTGLQAGTTYDIRVQAVNRTGNKGTVSPAKAAATDGIPSAFTVTVASYANELDVSWTGASASNGQSVSYTAAVGATTKAGTSSAQFPGLNAGTSYTVTVTATDAAGSKSVSASGTPWGRTALVECHSTDKGFDFPTASTTCEGPGNGPNATINPPPAFTWAMSQPPQGSTPLYREYGTTTPQFAFTGTEYWYTNTQNQSSPGLAYVNPNDVAGITTWVFPTQQAAGPGSIHVCEARVDQVWMGQQTSYYNLFAYGQQPSPCMLDFWT